MKLSARNRLALTYLTIIMVLSLGFSTLFYYQSMNAAGGGFRRQINQLRDRDVIGPRGPSVLIERIRQEELDRFKADLLWRLLFINIAMLGGGFILSTVLARKSLKPLEDALETQARFSSDAAHELRTPLTTIKTEVEVALRTKQLSTKEAKEVLKSTLEEINSLESLTTALLRLSTYEQGIKHFSRVDLSSLLQRAYQRVEKLAKTQDISFSLPSSNIKVKADPDQLTEAFVILFDNAIKYGKAGMTVTVETSQDGHGTSIIVSDEGLGIYPKDLPHIFDRFYRADTSRGKQHVPGYGLGLSLARNIIEAHKGNITVSSEVGTGTTFTVSLP